MIDNIPQRELIIGIIEKDDSILMRKKFQGSPPYSETWYMFGCERISTQDDQTTLKNYLQEKIGIEVEVSKELIEPAFEFKQDNDGIEKKFFYINLRCQYLSGVPKIPEGAEKVEWISKSKLKNYDLVPPSVKLLKQLNYPL